MKHTLHNTYRNKHNTFKLVTIVLTVLSGIMLFEISLRIVEDRKLYIWPPGIKRYYLPHDSIMPGIRDTSFISINSFGFRTAVEDTVNGLNIVLLGGSSTECLYLDQQETWGEMLGTKLRSKLGTKLNVFNGGKSGLNSQDHIFQVKKLLSEHNWIDIIIIMMGMNDLGYALSKGEAFSRMPDESIRVRAFYSDVSDENIPIYKQSMIYKKLYRLLFTASGYILSYNDPEGLFYVSKRNERRAGIIVEQKIDLSKSLSNYEENISTINELCKAKGVQLILIDQATIWENNLSKQYEDLCWGGFMRDSEQHGVGLYLSIGQLGLLINEYNSTMEKVSAKNSIPFIKISSALEKDTTTFYDDCHFNESGARKVSDLLVKSLIELRIFDKYTDARQLQNGGYTPIKPTF